MVPYSVLHVAIRDETKVVNSNVHYIYHNLTVWYCKRAKLQTAKDKAAPICAARSNRQEGMHKLGSDTSFMIGTGKFSYLVRETTNSIATKRRCRTHSQYQS